MLNRILEAPGISRTTTALALATQIPYRVLPLVAAAAGDADGSRSTRPRQLTAPGQPGPVHPRLRSLAPCKGHARSPRLPSPWWTWGP